MIHLCWVSGWVRRVASDGVLTYVMDLVDQDGLNVSRSCGFKVVSEFRGFDEALTAKYRQKLRGDNEPCIVQGKDEVKTEV